MRVHRTHSVIASAQVAADAVAAAAACVSHGSQRGPGRACRDQALERGANVGAKGDPRCVGHGATVQVGRLPGRLLSSRQDVLHRNDLGLLGQSQDLGLERSQLTREPAVRVRERLARLVKCRGQGFDLSNELCSLAEGLDDQHLSRCVRVRHAAGTTAWPD